MYCTALYACWFDARLPCQRRGRAILCFWRGLPVLLAGEDLQYTYNIQIIRCIAQHSARIGVTRDCPLKEGGAPSFILGGGCECCWQVRTHNIKKIFYILYRNLDVLRSTLRARGEHATALSKKAERHILLLARVASAAGR